MESVLFLFMLEPPMLCAWRNVFLLLAILPLAGCSPIQKGKSILLPVKMSADSVVLDVFWVRVPFGNTAANETLWETVDEQLFPSDLQDRLAHNGFRVGMVTGQMPSELTKLLELDDKPPPTGNIEEVTVQNPSIQQRVTRRHIQLRADHRSEIQTSSVYDNLLVLLWENGRLTGQPYSQAQGLFAIKAFPQSNGQVQLQLAPELYHDQPKQRYITEQGLIRMDVSRPKRAFDDMMMTPNLSPGSILIVTSLPNKPGSLGHHFFTENGEEGEKQEQKLLVIRLSQTQHTGLFDAPSEPLNLPTDP
jgi:hypothetical protein